MREFNITKILDALNKFKNIIINTQIIDFLEMDLKSEILSNSNLVSTIKYNKSIKSIKSLKNLNIVKRKHIKNGKIKVNIKLSIVLNNNNF